MQCLKHASACALQLVRSTIMPAATTVTSGHLALLKNKILTALMRRLDSSMFEKLMEGVLESFVRDSQACLGPNPSICQHVMHCRDESVCLAQWQ